MKKIYCVLVASLFLISCSSKNINSDKERKIAIANKKVGEGYYKTGKYTAALRTLLEASKIIPQNPYLHNSLGLVYLAKERYDIAEKHFKTALNLKTDYFQAKNNLGVAYLKQKKWKLSIICFEEIANHLLYTTPEKPLSNLGWVYFHQKMYKLAKSYFQKALDTKPDFLIALHGIASIYIETGYYAKAVLFLNYKLNTNPKAAILYSDLAQAFEGLNNYEQAKKSWNQVLKLSPATSLLAKKAKKQLDLYNLERF